MPRHKPPPKRAGRRASGHLFLLSVVRQNCAGFHNGSRVRSAKRLARVDFPPPVFPNTATLFIWHARSTCPPDAPSGSKSTSIDKHKTSALTGGNEPSGRALLRFCAFPFFLGGLLGQAKFL